MMHEYWTSNNGMNYNGAGYWFMAILTVMIIVAIALSYRHIHSGEKLHYFQRESAALDVIKHRYAKGEIDKKEYEEKRDTLAN